jgi:capsular polysaccharide transport system permease protein
MSVSHASALAVQARVVGALMLRDTRTRFGRTFFGYVFIVAKPLMHLLLILALWLTIRGRVALLGTNAAVFWATGLLPYVFFSSISA